ncbi:AAA family ATPase [Peribacillus simplex]
MKSVVKLIPKLIRASFEGDARITEAATINIIRKIRTEYPEVAQELANILANQGAGAPVTRSLGIDPPPTDNENYMSLLKIEEFIDFQSNISLSENVSPIIERFLKERGMSNKLLLNGIKPPNSIILHGPPGVGKTYLAKYLASRLSLPLLTLDLATSISSYLGKTGQNVKKVMDYAKNNPSILFLDEFDAIAKKRDDPTDLGELKRIVNVLLKELEQWSNHSIVIAATNHPEIIDKAIWRRFDLNVELGLPNEEFRKELLETCFDSNIVKFDSVFIQCISHVSEGLTPSDIKQLTDRVHRQILIDEGNPYKIVLQELRNTGKIGNKNYNSVVINALKNHFGKNLKQAEIAEWLGISVSTVNHHLKSNKLKKGDINE